MKIDLDRNELNYVGRIDISNPKKPEFVFPASSVEIHFIGKSASIEVVNKQDYYRSFIGAIIDGKMNKFELLQQGKTVIKLIDQEKETEHTILIFKMLDSCHEFLLEKLELSEKAVLLPAEEKPRRKIEFYGDSITAGEITEADKYLGKEDPQHEGEYSNVWYSYAWMTARKLNAQIHDIAQGGIALLNGTGWYQEPNYLGMEKMWDAVHYSPKFGKVTRWDFTKFIPDVVVISIGQNDSQPEDYMAEDYYCEKAIMWRKEYKKFVLKIRSVYPDTWVVLQTTLMYHNQSWDKAIQQVCKELEDDKVSQYLYRRNGIGTPGHLRIPESEEMALELTDYIEKTCYKK